MNEKSGTAEKSSTSAGKRFKFFPEILLFGAALLCVASISPREWSLIFYYCDCRYWPAWFSGVLWIFAAASVLVLLFRNRKTQKGILLVSVAAAASLVVVRSVWLHALFKMFRGAAIRFFREAIIPYVYMPITELLTTGRVTPRLLILAVVLSAVLVLLFILRVRIGRRKTKPVQRED